MRRYRSVLVILVAVVAVLFGATSVGAHSGLAAASPGPGAVVGGEILEVQMFYGDIITTFEATVTSPSGDELASTSEMTSDIQGLIRLNEPITEPGEYAVRHTITSFDDDVVTAAYLFSYDPSAPAPQLIFVPEDESGISWILWTVIGLGVVVIAVLAWRLVAALRRRSSVAT